VYTFWDSKIEDVLIHLVCGNKELYQDTINSVGILVYFRVYEKESVKK
jgi:hypothetical protein